MQHDDQLPAHLVIMRWWHRLIQAADPGTPTPHTTSLARWIPPTVVEERARLAAEERAERTDLAPGERPVPVDLDVIQTAIDVTAAVLTVEEAVRRHLNLTLWQRDDWHPLTVPGACTDLDVLARLLPWDRRQWIEDELRPAATAVLAALGRDPRPMILRHPCPGCGGRLLLVSEHRLGEHVRCVGTGPDDVYCVAVSRGRVWGRPIWRAEEFASLAQLLDDGAELAPVEFIDDTERAIRAALKPAHPDHADTDGRPIPPVTDAA